MNPDVTLQASREVEVDGEEGIPARGFPSPTPTDTQRNSGTRIDASASPIVVRSLSEGEGNKPSAFSPTVSIDYFFMGHLYKRKHKVCFRKPFGSSVFQ